MSAENKALVEHFFDQVCNKRQLGLADQLFAAHHVHHDPSSPWVGTGPQGMKDLIGLYQRSFPDAHWAVHQIIEAGDTVVTRWTGIGTHSADLMGIAPTNKHVSVDGIWIHRISAGKIVESWVVWDTLGMLQQLGVAAPMGRAGGRGAA